MQIRRLLAIGCFIALVLLSIDLERVVRPFADRDALREELHVAADGPWWPDYPRFLEQVRRGTHEGDVIAIDFPRDQYEYGYYRASYLLAGREVVPLSEVKRANVIAIMDATHRGRLVRR